jgi:hypothetical protein
VREIQFRVQNGESPQPPGGDRRQDPGAGDAIADGERAPLSTRESENPNAMPAKAPQREIGEPAQQNSVSGGRATASLNDKTFVFLQRGAVTRAEGRGPVNERTGLFDTQNRERNRLRHRWELRQMAPDTGTDLRLKSLRALRKRRLSGMPGPHPPFSFFQTARSDALQFRRFSAVI